MILGLILAALLPSWEMRVIDRVSVEYGLSKEQRSLLVAIRKAENGCRYHFGVTNRRCNTYLKQAKWAANTIRIRYKGDIEEFGARWCPINTETWVKNVRWFMFKQGFVPRYNYWRTKR